MENCRLRYMVSIDKGQCVRVQRRHRANSLVQRDETVARLDQRPKHLQGVGIGGAHLDRLGAQLDPPTTITAVRHLDQHWTLALQRSTVVAVGHAERLLLPAPRLRVRGRPPPDVEHDGSWKEEEESDKL